ncbi:probable xyloglucan endotransglucosylase/hydrolase protein 26 [Ananas comosus]|uniref:Xyloglucan endotransglucosylase/hydrolase n=1 Tax=Ananas comosus TaxID=4615 RepID=A0A199V8Z3_ANACO|nr:probable xyloglucan endotransglucosylase/hydrolase protein 26 [Ananas comosus]OAY73488.1 putative xyloglucan endotransglucosylase/hydrolase protein 26 [Ananas comosus]
MANSRALFFAFVALIAVGWGAVVVVVVDANFASETSCNWGGANCKIDGDNLQFILNKWSGAGIVTKQQFIFGSIEMQIKLVPRDSAGTVTTYYTSSTGNKHNEVDFEFLGNVSGQPYTIHTNIFVGGVGNREEQFRPWFDPTDGYHTYTIFWNPSMILWSIDGTPIRVFKNRNSKGIPFPLSQPMKGYTSLWNADDWATQGGRIKTNWSHAPFIANYKSFQQRVCAYAGPNSARQCAAPSAANWYTAPQYKTLSRSQIDQLNSVRNKYMIYNYCKDTNRFNGKMAPECSYPPY